MLELLGEKPRAEIPETPLAPLPEPICPPQQTHCTKIFAELNAQIFKKLILGAWMAVEVQRLLTYT